MSSLVCDVVVIGAGISGLAAAYPLARDGACVEVIEASARAGGVIESEERDGFLFERGPNSMVDGELADILDTLGIAKERIDVSGHAAKRYVVKGGELIPMPMSPRALVRSRLFTPRAKLRLLKEPFIAPAPQTHDESLAAFVTRRLGREFLDYAIEPFAAGVYAADSDELAVSTAFPRLYALEQRHSSLIRGAMRGGSHRAPKSFSFTRGMQTLPDALACAVGTIRTSTRVTHIARTSDGPYEVTVSEAGATSSLHARAVVIATPASAASALVRPFASRAADALSEITYAPIASIALGYPRADVAHRLDGFGFLVPRVEQRRILGCLFSSSMFEGRAPRDHVLLTVFIGGRRNPELMTRGDDQLASIAHDELRQLVGARVEPRFTAITRWSHAIPQYTLGHRERLQRLEETERSVPGVFFCGSYRGGVSVGDCIRTGRTLAANVAQFSGFDARQS